MSDTSMGIRVGRQGRVVIPADLRRQLGIKAGQRLLARASGNSIVLEPKDAIVRRLRETVPKGVDLVDELLNERRRESRREQRPRRR